MHQLEEGMNVDPQMHIQVLENRVALLTVREIQMEAAVQQLLTENRRLYGMIPTDEEVKEDASADSQR